MELRFTTDLSSILMDSTDSLGSEILNKKFNLLLNNDVIISQSFANVAGIWQCLWYYDSSRKGYSIGDAMWLNTENQANFIKAHAAIIKDYTDLNPLILTKLPEYNESDPSIVAKYKNALSGYADTSLGRDVVLPPIFDIGDESKPIQLAISLKNDNKSLLSDKSAWATVFVDDISDEVHIRHLIDEYVADTLIAHLKDYHLSGHEEIALSYLSSFIDAPSASVSYTDLSSSYFIDYSKLSSNNAIYGFDYVEFYIRKPLVLSGEVSQYQGVRYWRSGLLEHFGTIATSNESFFTDSGDELMIPFNWEIANDESGAKAYKSGALASTIRNILSALETKDSFIPPEDNLINVMYEKKNVAIKGRSHAIPFKSDSYNISIAPIYQTQEGLEPNYIPISYGAQKLNQNWNSNYLTNEILSRKDKRYATMRLGTRVLPPYISYYAVGDGDF